MLRELGRDKEKGAITYVCVEIRMYNISVCVSGM